MESIRSEIEDIDLKLLQLLKERFKKSELIGKYKKNNNLPIYDSDREKELLNKLQDKKIIDPNYVKHLWSEIFFISRCIQKDTINN
jgi:hypothetical protein